MKCIKHLFSSFKVTVIFLRVFFYHRVKPPKDTDIIENDKDPDQMASL